MHSRPRPDGTPQPASPQDVYAIEDGTPSIKEQIDIILLDDAFLVATEVIPPKRPGSVGRPRSYPDFTWPLCVQLRAIFGNYTAVVRELYRGGWWDYIRTTLLRLRPELPPLPSKPPNRQLADYHIRRYLATDDALMQTQELHARFSVAQAKEAGNFAAGGSFTHPSTENTLYGDGTAIPPLYKSDRATRRDRQTGELRSVRTDPEAAWHREGGGNAVHGHKFALLSSRRTEGRFIHAIEHVMRNEAAAALRAIRQVSVHAPEAQTLGWDMAIRGIHQDTLMTELGLIPIVKVHAAANRAGGKGRHKGSFTPKVADIESKMVTLPDGSQRTIQLAAQNGWLAIKELTETGDPHYTPLKPFRIQRHGDKNRFRLYGYYRLPPEYGGGEISVRLHTNDEDRRRGLNRAEVLRAIPEGSDDFSRLHALRSDAESINNHLSSKLYLRRASAKGWRRLMVDLLGYARVVNAITLARARARASIDSAA